MLLLALALAIVRPWLGLAGLGIECIVAGMALSFGSTPPLPAEPDDDA